ncbi:hypothetical protein [Falsirhodobacter sp. 20TX0035]|uniref:hypothetical protein n=1 Tax=Falsirhodobacter sp. 20TX0035 TaxID=3022019 RepID=UPI0023302FE9|nr:hypothetical protein [Falsirhodobacter sp. 20TX0035]MDB6453480.1 hypothetical protein [Falsirhodobacter sp. 20TX0035]
MKQNDETGKKGVRGPMRIVFAIIIVGIIAIVATSFFADRGPQADDTTGPATQTN